MRILLAICYIWLSCSVTYAKLGISPSQLNIDGGVQNQKILLSNLTDKKVEISTKFTGDIKSWSSVQPSRTLLYPADSQDFEISIEPKTKKPASYIGKLQFISKENTISLDIFLNIGSPSEDIKVSLEADSWSWGNPINFEVALENPSKHVQEFSDSIRIGNDSIPIARTTLLPESSQTIKVSWLPKSPGVFTAELVGQSQKIVYTPIKLVIPIVGILAISGIYLIRLR